MNERHKRSIHGSDVQRLSTQNGVDQVRLCGCRPNLIGSLVIVIYRYLLVFELLCIVGNCHVVGSGAHCHLQALLMRILNLAYRLRVRGPQ